MQQNFNLALAFTLREEGGFVSDPRDNGGPTNLGVTQRVWEAYIGTKVDEKAMRALTRADVMPLYRSFYWDKIAGDFLPAGLDLALFDFAVNSGPRRASRTLQQLLNVEPDGIIGPITLAAMGGPRHCEERSDEAIQTKIPKESGLPRRLFEPPRNDEKNCTQTPPVIARSEATRQSMESDRRQTDCQVLSKYFFGSSSLLAMTDINSAPPDTGEARGSGAPNISLLIANLTTARLEFLRTLPAFAIFGKGWTARVNRAAELTGRMV